jgi:hypothetical protein
MYKVKFHIDSFGSSLATMSQSFSFAGAGERVRVKRVGDPVGSLDRREYFVARSKTPFAVIIATRGDGGDSHLDGDVKILVATNERGNPGASVFVAIGGDNPEDRLILEPGNLVA